MALPKVDINFQAGQLGRVDDPGAGYAGLIVVMASAPTGHAFGDVKTYTTYDDLPAELQAIQACKDFFNEAPGYKVYLMPVVDTVAVEDIIDPQAVAPYAKTLVEFADDINFIGVANAVVALAEVGTAGTNGKALRAYFEPKYRYIRTFVAVAYDATLPDLGTADYTATGFVVCPAGDEIGLFLGRRAKIRVQEKVGKVKLGALVKSTAELVTGTPLEEDMIKVEEVYDKRYISLRTYIGKTGYYFSNDLLAVSPTDDYASDVDRAVIDKAAIITYGVYVNELLDDVETETDGSISTTGAKELQGAIENAINAAMTANDEITGVSAFVDETQNIVSTNKVEIVLKIQKKGYLEEIVVNLGFEAPTV